MKTAIVHEFFHTLGGAENVLRELHNLYPKAPIYFLTKNNSLAEQQYPTSTILTSYVRRFPQWFHKHPQTLLPFLSIAAESLNLRDFDLVLSSSNSFSKGIVTRSYTTHICYCHSPTRYLWDYYHETVKEHPLSKGLLKLLFHHQRLWDVQAASRVDAFIANSQFTADRIQKYYQRDSIVVYPPVDTERFTPTKSPKGAYLIVSRLSKYKKIDAAIHACNALKRHLIIIGEGKEQKKLKRIAGPTIEFKGFIDQNALKQAYEQSRALLFPGIDDFGMVPVEALSAGTPVLALRKGGVLETQIEGVTAEFFNSSDSEEIITTMKRFEKNEHQYTQKNCRSHSEIFSKYQFQKSLEKAIQQIISTKH